MHQIPAEVAAIHELLFSSAATITTELRHDSAQCTRKKSACAAQCNIE